MVALALILVWIGIAVALGNLFQKKAGTA